MSSIRLGFFFEELLQQSNPFPQPTHSGMMGDRCLAAGFRLGLLKYLSVKRIKREMLKGVHNPRKTAVSFALGVGLAFSPFVGLHLVAGLILSRIFKLNVVIVITAALIHNPWTMLPIHFVALLVGDLMLNGHPETIYQFYTFPWHDLGLQTMFSGDFWATNGPYLGALILPFFVGSLMLSGIFGGISYQATFRFLHRRLHREPSA